MRPPGCSRRCRQRSGIDSDRFTTLCSLGRVTGLQGDDAQARVWFAQALAVPDHGEPLRRNAAPFCTMGQVEAALIGGHLADAAALLQGVGDVARLPRPARTGWLALQAELAWRQGDAARAERLARQWLGDAQAIKADEARRHLQATVRPGHRWRRWAEGA